MKDDTSTPTPDGSSPNAFEEGKPGTRARDKAEAAIEELRQRGGVFVEAVRATRMPMLLTDPTLPGNPIVFANQAFLGLSGYRMDEVLGQQPHFMNGPGTDPNDAARFAEAIRADQDDIIETVQYRKNGSRFVATVLISAFKNEEGRTLNHFMSVLDVTRRAQAEDEIADLKTAQALLRDSEERQRFLLSLGDAMRAESAPDDKIAVAARLLGDKLNASRVLLTEYDWTRNVALTFAGWIAEGAEPFVSIQQLEDYEGEVLNDLKEGRLVRVDDIGARINEPAYAEIAHVGVQALLSPPLLIDGKLKFNVSVHQHEPRHWTDDDVALVKEVSERLWAEIVRARAEEALRESEAKYRTLFESIDEGFCEFDLIFDDSGRCVDFIYRKHNPALTRLTGLRDIEGKPVSEVVPRLEAVWFERYAEVAKTGEPARFEEYVQDLGRWFQSYASRVGGPGSRTIVVVYNDITERKNAEAALSESEARLAAAFESVPVGLGVIDQTGTAVICNAEFRRFLPSGIVPSQDSNKEGRWQAWDASGRPIKPNEWPSARALRGESVVPGLEMLFTDDTGREIWTNVATQPIRDGDGNIVGAASAIADIDAVKRSAEALRESERHANLLLAELQHRVRNTLAIIRSIARRTAENSSSAEDMLAHFQGRLDAFSRVQAALTRNAEGRVDLMSIVEDELIAHASHGGEQVQITGPEILLEPKMAERLSLAVHELTTNAVKYGALTNGDGSIRISWAKEQNGAGEQFVLHWTESGVDVDAKKASHEGFGMELLRRSLPYDLGAETKVDLTPQGLRFELRMPFPNGSDLTKVKTEA